MWSSWRVKSRSWQSLTLVAVGLALAYAVWGVAVVNSSELPQVVAVEEDWELIIADPDSGNAAPQVTCTFSPQGNLDGLHAVLEINHKTVPYWAAGGVHLQTWVGEYNLTRKSIENTSSMSTAGETVRWTNYMGVNNNTLTFSIRNGTSTTWGTFGGGTYLHAWYGTSLTNLNSYSPDFSVANSGVGFASNRVQSLVLKRVRYKLANGDVVTDDVPRVIHQSSVQLEPEP